MTSCALKLQDHHNTGKTTQDPFVVVVHACASARINMQARASLAHRPATPSKLTQPVRLPRPGTACAWSLSRFPERFDVHVWEALAVPGGVASSRKVKDGEGDVVGILMLLDTNKG